VELCLPSAVVCIFERFLSLLDIDVCMTKIDTQAAIYPVDPEIMSQQQGSSYK
jgi:hypothetical protein